MLSIREVSSLLRTGFLLRLFDVKTIVRWADVQILQGCKEEELVELSLSGGKSEGDVIALLKQLSGNDSTALLSNNFFLGYYREQLLEEPDSWFEIEAHVLNYLFLDRDLLDEELNFQASVLAEDFSLRNDRLPGSMEMPRDLMLFLESYSGFHHIHEQLMNVGVSLEFLK